jgi:DNA-binding MarR family transcriptional regulator
MRLALLGPECCEQSQQRCAQRLQFLGAGQLRPMLLDRGGRGVRDWSDRQSSRSEEHQLGAVVERVRLALDVAHALELIDRLGHRLLAHPGEVGEGRDADAFRRHEREHVGVRGPYVAEAGLAQRGVDVLGVVLVDQSQQEPDQWVGRESWFHGIDRFPFGQTLAFAERTLTAVLRQHLAERQTTPETWYALQLIASRGPALSRQTLSHDLEGSPALDADSTRQLLARLEAEGLIRGDAVIALTPEGESLHRSLRDYVARPTAELLGQFDPDDIATTVRTLQAITERAAEGLVDVSPTSGV